MNNLCSTIETLFTQINSEKILSTDVKSFVSDSYVDVEHFTYIHSVYNKDYTIDQNRIKAQLLTSKWMRDGDLQKTYKGSKTPSVFNTLLHFSQQTLILDKDDDVRCDFKGILKWQKMIENLGEDLFVTSFLASRNLKIGKRPTHYMWRPYVKCSSSKIEDIVTKQISDIHNHLQGSTLNFEVNWVYLMNHTFKLSKKVEILDRCLKPKYHLNPDIHIGWYAKVIQASVIRLMLFRKLFLNQSPEPWMLKICQMRSDDDIRGYGVNNLRSALQETRQMAFDFVLDTEGTGKTSVLDYAIQKSCCEKEERNNIRFIYAILAGERRLMYEMFCKIYGDDEDYKELSRYFYAYLNIKSSLRQELIQVNDSVGFGNFDLYETRKKLFVDGVREYETILNILAIWDFAYDYENRYIETRIAPPERISVDEIEDAIVKKLRQLTADLLNNKYFPNKEAKGYSQGKGTDYAIVYHFIKKPCSPKTLKPCRDYGRREMVRKQSLAINSFREKYQEESKLLVGIDAANSEMNCRPEVFAQAFRFLQDFNPSHRRHLGVTYHVGEDFCDIVSGLRAVDEAIIFLDLKEDARIGHGLVLGVDAEKYYTKRGYYVVMSKQEFLDNVVWLWSMGMRYNLLTDSDKEVLGNLYKDYSDYIYKLGNGIDVSIETYRMSMLLRGDNPEAYRSVESGKTSKGDLAPWEMYNYCYQKDCVRARRNRSAQYIYSAYHFDEGVKGRGAEMMEEKIEDPKHFTNILTKIQKIMLKMVAQKGIRIECNPTSNLKIGDFDKYDELPIRKFYSKGLPNGNTHDDIEVSINTDDRGIFSTSLEREYALMACALIRNGVSADSVYEWLDAIRRMSNHHAFKDLNIVEEDRTILTEEESTKELLVKLIKKLLKR